MATRFTLPVRALAYSPSGLNLAVAGDDEGIKLVDMSDAEQGECRVFRQLAAQASPLRSLIPVILLVQQGYEIGGQAGRVRGPTDQHPAIDPPLEFRAVGSF